MNKDRRISALLLNRFVQLCMAVILAIGICAAQPASAQLVPSTDSETATDAPVAADPFERQTPRSSITALLSALAADDYERAAHYFPGIADPSAASGPDADDTDDTATATIEPDEASSNRSNTGAELARKLKLALNSDGKLLPFAALSNDPKGNCNDGNPTVEEVGTIRVGDQTEPILLKLSENMQSGQMEWRIAAETADTLAEWEPSAAVVNAETTSENQIAGAPIMDWVQLIGLALILFFGLRLLAAAGLTVLRRAISEHDSNIVYRTAHAALPPLALYGAVVAFFFIATDLHVSIVARQTLLRVAGIAAWVSLGWFLLRLIDAASRIMTERMERAERRQAASIVTLLRRAAKLFLLVIVAIAIFDTFGVDVTTGIAALGIGGLALALGAQKTIENVVGSVTIIADRPVQVGDAAQIGEVFGVVEDIGLRSTRVRTLDRTLVTIPNGYLASERIENYAERDRFLFRHTIGVTYDTEARMMQKVLEEMRQILAENDNVIEDEARVRFIGFGDSSLNIEVYAYFRTRTFSESLAMQEDLLLSFMDKLDSLGVNIAFPTRTVIMENTVGARENAALSNEAR